MRRVPGVPRTFVQCTKQLHWFSAITRDIREQSTGEVIPGRNVLESWYVHPKIPPVAVNVQMSSVWLPRESDARVFVLNDCEKECSVRAFIPRILFRLVDRIDSCIERWFRTPVSSNVSEPLSRCQI
jgi:hypothetical protein